MIKFTCSIFISFNNFVIKFFLHILKFLKIHQPNIIKKIKKDIKVFLKKQKKKKKQLYDREQYKNLAEDEKQKFVKYREKYKMKKLL